MKLPFAKGRRSLLAAFATVLTSTAGSALAQPAASPNEIRILELQGTVEVSPARASTWVLTQTNQVLHPGDKLRTGPNSRVTLRWSDQSVVPFSALTEIEILEPDAPGALSGLHLLRGLMSFFHRDQPGRIRVITRGAVAGVEGTEFVLAVEQANGSESTTISVIDGRVKFSNLQGSLIVTNSGQAVAGPGEPPRRTAGFIVNNLMQWCFYYPAVLDLRDLPLTIAETQTLSESLAAYRSGDLLAALAKYPPARQPVSAAEQVYHAALLLSVGQVEKTETALAALPAGNPEDRLQRLAAALRQLIAAVKRQPADTVPQLSTNHHQLSTELLAASYYEQSRAIREQSLEAALRLAQSAAAISPASGFAWARVAELEFGFGHTGAALAALDKSLALAPRNAQALALKGFLAAARNQTGEAMDWFNRALAADSALGNAWLGRGLCKIHRRDSRGGQEDLLVATALEPQRALLRSYLGKAYANAGDLTRARHELALARSLDPADPTAFLYSALVNQQANRLNEGIRDLERSEELNDNRGVYRSKLLLDQDRAVRGANLAQVYADAGMADVSMREAARAAGYDWGNYSAHQFLAESYDALRDPTRFNLRYETTWFNELLLANLLSPVGGTPLSQNVSQQEYSRLFDQNHIGLGSSTEYRSDGQVRELASQYGTIGNTGWSLDLDYQHNDGIRTNNGLDRIEWYSTIKEQITPQDSLLVLTKYEDYHSGDNFQYYYATNARPHYTFDENQSPIILAGYHHEWSPGMHTLVLGGRLVTEQTVSDLAAPQLLLVQNSQGKIYAADAEPFDVRYHSDFEIYTAELNQIFQWNRVTLSVGARYQSGTFNTQSSMTNSSSGLAALFNTPAADASLTNDFERITGYGYLTVEPLDRLWLTGGLAYDDITYPSNYRNPPLSGGESHQSQTGPKAAFVWNPVTPVTLRGVYTRSLGGVSLDESYRLEPTQLAGFPQAFRTLISESAVGSVSVPQYQTFGLALDAKLSTKTYAGIQAERLEAKVSRTIGVFSLEDGKSPFVADSTAENLDYRENAIGASVSQLVGDWFVLGANYKYADVQLHDTLPNVPVSALASADTTNHADLHQLTGYVVFNHPSGFFSRAEASWYHQHNSGYSTAMPGDDFVQENFYLGYRFAHRHAEILVGILNLSGQDYHLNSLTTYSELPRERTFMAKLSFQF